VDSSYVQPRPKFHVDLKLKQGSATFTPDGKGGYTFEISAESNGGPLGMAGPVTL
jgi:hypothetical protein